MAKKGKQILVPQKCLILKYTTLSTDETINNRYTVTFSFKASRKL